MSARTRSPNYPSMTLGEAIEAIKKVYAVERRTKFPRTSLAAHLGYNSLNGRSLAKIGAIRAYGLIDGREDDLSVSATAIAILEAPDGSQDKVSAYRSAFLSPGIFARAHEHYGDTPPSPQTFRWWLTQQGYIGDAADKTMHGYLASLELVNSQTGAYEQAGELQREEEFAEHLQTDPKLQEMFYAAGKAKAAPKGQAPKLQATEGLGMSVQERVLQSGMLSKRASYRVIVSGPISVAELERLIAKLEMDKEILADDDDETDLTRRGFGSLNTDLPESDFDDS